ncbi:MAG: hypothetical protein QM781_03100 [Chitinophagaceae bacterium]
MKPNLFDIGTRELIQDAFICWLINWANPENRQHDEALHNCAIDFVRRLIQTNNYEVPSKLLSVSACRQYSHIDVLAKVSTAEKDFLLVIEDKVNAFEGDGQLNAYRQTGESLCAENGSHLVCCYIKTGNESKRTIGNVSKAGFYPFLLEDFLTLFDRHSMVKNDIFNDFADRLRGFNQSNKLFETVPFKDWDDECWVGFFVMLENKMNILHWHYVNRINGNGFWNASLNWDTWEGFPVYLQIEQGPLCFKIATHPEEIEYEEEFYAPDIRDEWHTIVMEKAKEQGRDEIKKPKRLGSGKFMTVASVAPEYWFGDTNGLINTQDVIVRLKGYLSFLKECNPDTTGTPNVI